MRTKSNYRYIQVLGFLLFFGLCITMLSKEVTAYADSDVKLNVKSVAIIKDGTFRLKVYNMTETETVLYRSGNTDIATVSTKGLITGITNGITDITATVIDGDTIIATLQCDVLIGPAAISIKLTKSELTLAVGMKKTLKTIILPINTVENAVFYSSDSAIAAVSSVGRVRAKEPGQVQIFAFLANSQSALCTVNVLSSDDYQLYLKDKSPEEITSEEPEEDYPDEEEHLIVTPSESNGTDNTTPAFNTIPSAAPTSIPQVTSIPEVIPQEASISANVAYNVDIAAFEASAN